MPNRPTFAADFFKSCRLGFDRLSHEAQESMRKSIESSQETDGLFVGRHRTGDLYYTFFGLLLAVVTNARIDLHSCKHALSAIDIKALDLVHSCVWLRANRLLKLLSLPSILRSNVLKHFTVKAHRTERQIIESFNSFGPDAFPQSDPLSPYSRFLLLTLYADFGLDLPPTDIRQYRLKSGLYANIQNDIEYGVNATASAMFLIPEALRQESAKALHGLQQNDGSFKAVEKAPCGDLLSTGTAYFALNKFGMPPRRSTKSFLRTCIREDGLFGATPDDPCSDLEYTVYALLSLGGPQ
jgi:hypothetical protein